MQECAVANRFMNNLTDSGRETDCYYSVEFPVKGLAFQYQFKVRRIGAESMSILVREDSNILKRLRVGNILTMKYSPIDAACPSDYLDTAIMNITKNREGRFKGHYLVGLKIMKVCH